jgi:hypothetical protein
MAAEDYLAEGKGGSVCVMTYTEDRVDMTAELLPQPSGFEGFGFGAEDSGDGDHREDGSPPSKDAAPLSSPATSLARVAGGRGLRHCHQNSQPACSR